MATGTRDSGSIIRSHNFKAGSGSLILSDILMNPKSYGLLQLIHIIGIDNIRFRTKLSLAPRSTVVEDITLLSKAAESREPKYCVSVNKFNLLGAEGPLPTNYTDMVLQYEPKTRAAITEFLDIFSDRFIRLHFKIKQKYLIGLSNTVPSKSVFFKMLSSIAGFDVDNKDNSQESKLKQNLRKSLAASASLMFTQPKSLSALEIFLQSTYGVDIKIKPFVGRWRKFEKEQSFTLGKDRLSSNKFIGDKAWIQDDSVIITMGPMSQKQLYDFINMGDDRLMHMQIKNLLPPHINYKIVYDVKNPKDKAGRVEYILGKLYLGYNSFLNYTN